MGCWDIFCLLCGNPCHSKKYNDENLNDKQFELVKKITLWLNKCTILSVNNDIIHNCYEESCNIDFITPKNDRYITSLDYNFSYPSTKNKGLFIHDDCWLYIKNKYNIELKFSDLANTKTKVWKPLSYIDYGDIENYWGQEFNFPSIIKNENLWMCMTPLISTINAKRIDKIFKQLNIKKNRKGPTLSASFYKPGIIKFGNNDRFWIINGLKWTEMKGEIKIKKEELNKKHYKIPQLGETNTRPIFIKDFITEKKKHYVLIIYLK